MATTTEIRLIEFDKDRALEGVSLGFSSNGNLNGQVSNYILNFQLNNAGSITKRYSGLSTNGKRLYYFDDNGVCSDGNSLHNLFIVDAKIVVTSGTVATRLESGTEESIYIDILQPREYFAMYALQGILTKIENPLALDDGQITLISSTAFKIAQSMMSTAADYRAATQSEETPPPSVDVDINNVTSTTDKLLYNMSQSISGMQDSLKNIKDTMAGQEGKVKKVELSAVSVSEVPVRVTNDSLNTYVDNMPSVPSEPVSITGTVSVDNFPSSDTETPKA